MLLSSTSFLRKHRQHLLTVPAIGHFLLFACGRLCMVLGTPWGMCGGQRRCVRVGSFPPPRQSQGSNTRHQAWQQAPSPAAPSLQSDTHSVLRFLTSGLVYLSERSKLMPSDGELTVESKDGIFTASLCSNSINIETHFIALLVTL